MSVSYTHLDVYKRQPLGYVHPDQFTQHHTFGNVRERKFGDIWQDESHAIMAGLKDRKVLLKGRCRECRFLDNCNGNFRTRAEATTGDFWESDPACYLTDEAVSYTHLYLSLPEFNDEELVMTTEEKNPEVKTTMNCILIKPGQDPEICALPNNPLEQVQAIGDILGGNFASARLFDLGDNKSLHILVNDFAVPLGLMANRRFPGADNEEIIFGNAIFVAMDDEHSDQGPMDITEEVCNYFIEQLKTNLLPCKGDEKQMCIRDRLICITRGKVKSQFVNR